MAQIATYVYAKSNAEAMIQDKMRNNRMIEHKGQMMKIVSLSPTERGVNGKMMRRVVLESYM